MPPESFSKSPSADAAAWLHRASRLRRVVNGMRVLRTATPALVVLNAAAGAALVIARRADLDAVPVAWAYAPALIAILVVAWRRARPHFVNDDDMLARLESHYGLNSGLSAARAGYVPWPRYPESPGPAVRLVAAPWLIPLALFVALPVAGILTPRAGLAAVAKADAVAAPAEWASLDELLQQAEENKAAEEQQLARLRERLDELKKDNAEDAFGLASREATQSLDREVRDDFAKLARSLATTAELVGSMEKLAAQGEAAPRALEAAWEEALAEMDAAALKPDAATAAALRDIDLSQITPEMKEALAAARKKLAEKAGDCAACNNPGDNPNGKPGNGKSGNGVMSADDAAAFLARLEAATQPDLTKLPEPWKERQGSGPGTGELSRGRGDADLGLTNDSQKLAGNREKLPDSAGGADPGDKLGLVTRELGEDDVAEFRPSVGGDTTNTGTGGEAVRRDRLTPEEVDFLKRFHAAPAPKK